MSETFANTIDDTKLQRLYDDLIRLRGNRAFASRGDIDPINFKYILGNLVLVDVLYEPLRFRFRLVGTGVTLASGFDLTGRLLDEYPDPALRELLRETYTTIIRTGRPARIENIVENIYRPYRGEAIIVPLSDDGVVINMFIVGIARHDLSEPAAIT